MRLHSAYNNKELRKYLLRFYGKYYNIVEINSLLKIVQMFNIGYITLDEPLYNELTIQVMFAKLNIVVIDLDQLGVSNQLIKECIFGNKFNNN